MKKIYCLYEFSGRFANLYKDLGYEVYPIDLRLGSDIFSFNYKEHEDVVGIISHPPCTHFSIAGTATWKKKTPEQMRQAKAQVQIVLDIVAYHKPIFWFIENPIGRINKYIDLGKPRLVFQPYEYAGWSDISECYTKATQLWGQFNLPVKRELENARPTSTFMDRFTSSKTRAIFRSVTPRGFARAFVSANQP